MSSLLPAWCPPYSSTKVDPVTGVDVYCICKKPDEGELMVGCDGCDDWFHFNCMKIPTKYQKLVSHFYCPYCQAGITGQNRDSESELPRTLWKKKCRVELCYEPCMHESKYCSEEHGMEYVKGMVDKLNLTGTKDGDKRLLRSMVHSSNGSADKFSNLGGAHYIDDDIPPEAMDKGLFDTLLTNDSKLNDLLQSLQECKLKTYPELKQKLESLQSYIAFLDKLNEKLNEQGPDTEPIANLEAERKTTKSRKGKKKSSKQNRALAKKTICGYTPDFDREHPSVKSFLFEYHTAVAASGSEKEPKPPVLHDICIKMKCVRHADWAVICMDQLKQQMRSLESYKERLDLLVKTRKRQLHLQYYQQLADQLPAKAAEDTTPQEITSTPEQPDEAVATQQHHQHQHPQST
ncbi:Spp1p KNAG_0J01570 [Huiozyma naganishii CBS 8797]|uniref:PHD-type domain-containing protein n=1 Tax=Huiozyma naganishii (strain ATCC MYA-139 / BCRC 22969 / CBS 8797 / KCTC 17520 / NBRC 10181 / NCYC 3082 / Yp74L-3) TaxID=1071383 RepID=J7RQY4_HUIN7|nr:hypothetical protein KNAG_0J01570 [Kazachstania naganishii CBS 8797]CCK72238.1 hypothetical protein KNAG_0J01570 [Kazachstania naganishii CBS 8797]